MTSSWMPPRVIDDGHGNARLVAYDGREIVIQKRDIDEAIDGLIEVRDRYKTLVPDKED